MFRRTVLALGTAALMAGPALAETHSMDIVDTAAGAGNYVLDLPKLRKEIDADEMMYLAISPAYAHLPWATSEKVSPTLRKQLQQILSSLKSSTTGRQILKQAGLTNLKLATDDEYDPLRKIVDKVLKEKY